MSVVIGKTSGTRFELKAQSGRGMTAAVYEGIPEEGGGASVAIKVAYERMSAEDKQLFWDELEMLGKLANSNCVPKKAERGEYLAQQDKDDSERTGVIIQEWVPREWSLNQQINGAKDESLALAAASQYAGLLDFMFRYGVTTRGDRKLPDLHWDPLTKRLIVLDWNRAVADDFLTGEEDPAKLERGLDEEWRRASDPAERSRLRGEKDRLVLHRNHILTDIRLFGRLWGQLLGLNNLDSSKLPDLEDETEWGGLSLGTRHILAMAVQSRQSWGFQEPAQLKKAIDEHLTRLEVSAEILLAKAQELKGLVTNLPLWSQIEKAEIVLILIDLIERKRQTAENNYELTDLRSWANDLIKDTDKRFSEKVRTIYYYLNLMLFDQASRIIAEAQSEFTGDRAPMPYYQVILHRLHAAVAVGETGSRQLQFTDMEQRLPILRSYLDALALATPREDFVRDVFNKVTEKWTDVKANFGEEALGEMLRSLAVELELWTAVAYNNQRQIQEHWDDLHKTSPTYATALKTTYPSLGVMLDKRHVDDTSQRIHEARKQDFKKKVENLRQVLRKRAHSKVVDWGDLSQSIRPCEHAFYNLLEAAAEEEEAYAFVATTRYVNDCLRRGELDCVLKKLGESSDDQDWPIVRKVAAKTILLQIFQWSKERGWPADLHYARTLLNQIKASDQNTYYEKAQEGLEAWENDLKQWRKKIGVTDENWETRYNELSSVSANVKNEMDVDDCLEAAQAKNTELFQKSKLTLTNLIATRESNRLKTFISSITRLGTALDATNANVNVEKLLKDKALEFWVLSGRIESLLQGLHPRINQISDTLNSLYDLHHKELVDVNGRLTEQDKQLMSIKKRIDKLDTKTDEAVPDPAPIQPVEPDQFAEFWNDYQKVRVDHPDFLLKRRNILNKLQNLPSNRDEQSKLVEQEQNDLKKQEETNKLLIELKQEWQNGNIKNPALSIALDHLSGNNLPERTIECLRICHSSKLPQAYIELLREPILALSNKVNPSSEPTVGLWNKLNPVQMPNWAQEKHERVTTALLVLGIASLFDHLTDSATSGPQERQPTVSVYPIKA